MSVQLIKSLIPHLPRYAEEEGDFYSVPREYFTNLLCQNHTHDRAIIESTISLIESLLDTLAVLNAVYLQKGEWCFVSFPAQLLGTSVLTAMSDSNSRYFADNFWNTQGISNDKKEQQREVLKIIETARTEHHAINQAKPIRYCYVAWSIIKLNDKILFYLREDTKKRNDKTAGDYGLIGGRANQNDVDGIANKAELLKLLQSPNANIIKNALPKTLKRELREEAGLLFETHYTFTPWRSLRPYRQVQGAAPNHALTEYYLDIFQIDLTLDGYLFLLQKVQSDERLTWISIADINRGETTDGKILYINALYNDFDNRTALTAELSTLQNSFSASYLVDREKYGITLPVDTTKPILAGVLGKEKMLDVSLTARQLALILGFAANLRGFEFATIDENIVLHPYGWIEVTQPTKIQTELISLAAMLNGSDLVLENRCDKFFRVSITPEAIYFDDALFLFSVKADDLKATETKIQAIVRRQSFDTGFGKVKDKAEVFTLSLQFVHDLKNLSSNNYPTDKEEAIKIEDRYKKGLHQDVAFKALGLRNMVRREAGVFRFVLPYTLF